MIKRATQAIRLLNIYGQQVDGLWATKKGYLNLESQLYVYTLMSLPTTNVNDILLNFKQTTAISMDFVNKHDLIDIVGFFRKN